MQVDEMIARVDAAMLQGGVFPFLPDIRESLKQIKQSPLKSEEERSHLAGGLGRLVLESYDFSESDLGGALLAFADCYVDKGLI